MNLGIDVSKNTLDCCLISDGIFFEQQFKNNKAGFEQLKSWLKKNGATSALHCCCEATGKYYEAAADTLLTVLAEQDRFENQRQFTAYLGLDPKQFKSGTSVKGRERISKVGSSRLRTALYMPAMHAYRSRTFAPFVSRLQANGKRPKQIIVALMRKLAVIAYNLIKTGKDFEPERYK